VFLVLDGYGHGEDVVSKGRCLDLLEWQYLMA